MQRKYQFAQHSNRPIIHTRDTIKKSPSVDMMAALLTLKEEYCEDNTTCTADSDHSSDSEKTSQHSKHLYGDVNEQNEVTGVDISENKNVDNREAGNEKYNDMVNSKNDEQADKGVDQIASDVPTSITPISSSHGDNNDDCSNDTMSTLELDSDINDNPRSIFSNYWDGKDPKNMPVTVLSRSSSHCTSETSTPVASLSINSNASQTISLAHRMEREMHSLDIPRLSSVKSDMDEYEMALRGYEHGHGLTIIPRAAALNNQRNTTTKISFIDDTFANTENNDSSTNPKQHGPPPLSPRSLPRRNIFSNNYSKSKLPYCRSTSALTQQRRYRSCLRPLGRSISAMAHQSENTDQESEGGGKVTFDPNVRVFEYGRPHIVQASSRGWSKFFV